ncbi:hypothetical protein SAMCFNEI73_Ch2097 [Sinorhizobium americanum]|uniref:Uncharacterized protein n=1 Tax=Sinorhizobium americanum TaxID=194963 RepID=A0A1L3LMX4_9HYPH|nr:hypothetical protein SAMCFNEI73_Ch2097 [Sinorhizobium americanum]
MSSFLLQLGALARRAAVQAASHRHRAMTRGSDIFVSVENP